MESGSGLDLLCGFFPSSLHGQQAQVTRRAAAMEGVSQVAALHFLLFLCPGKLLLPPGHTHPGPWAHPDAPGRGLSWAGQFCRGPFFSTLFPQNLPGDRCWPESPLHSAFSPGCCSASDQAGALLSWNSDRMPHAYLSSGRKCYWILRPQWQIVPNGQAGNKN